MTTMYTMICEDNAISLNSHFYHVLVGSSPASQKAFFFLGGYCNSHHYYLAKRSNEDAQFRLRIAESLGINVYDLPCMVAKVETLVSHLRKHGSLPFNPSFNDSYIDFRKQTSPNFVLFSNTMCLERNT